MGLVIGTAAKAGKAPRFKNMAKRVRFDEECRYFNTGHTPQKNTVSDQFAFYTVKP
jgi:hypothetical protein